MSEVTSYSAIRNTLLFYNDSFQGGASYLSPSPSTLSSTTLTVRYHDKESGQVVARAGSTFNTYLLPFDGETQTSFSARVQKSSYLNLVQPIVSAYCDAALQKVYRDLGPLEDVLTQDVDYKESSYPEFISQCAESFAVYGFSFVVVDVDIEVVGKPRYIHVDPTKVCYLQVNDYGKLEAFAWVNSSEYKNETQPSIQTVTITLLDSTGFKSLRGTVDFSKGINLGNLEVVSSTPLSPTLGDNLPVVVGYYKRDNTSVAPLGISLVADAAHVGRTIFNLLSSAVDILGSHFPLLTLPMKKTGGALTAEAEIAIGTKSALPYDSDTNAPTYINPSKESTEELRNHADWLGRWVFKLVGLDIEQSSVPQSGISLRIKSREFEARVKAFAANLKKFETKLLSVTCAVLGIEPKGITVTYPDRFTLPDSSEGVANALAVLTLGKTVELGSTAKLAAVKYFLSSALPLGETELTSILGEIERSMKQAAQPVVQQASDVATMDTEPPTEPAQP
jgi:hypothetical protein